MQALKTLKPRGAVREDAAPGGASPDPASPNSVSPKPKAQEFIWLEARFQLHAPGMAPLVATVGTLKLKRGELLVLIGGNGSGKTTLARALTGDPALKLTAGSAPSDLRTGLMSFEGQMAHLEKDYLLRNSDAATPEEEYGLTARDLLSSLKRPQATMELICARLHLEPLLDEPLRHLSGGEGRRVQLALALCAGRDLIVLDNPFDQLDEASRNALLEALNTLPQDLDAAVVLIVNRAPEIPAKLTALGFIEQLAIREVTSRAALKDDALALLNARVEPCASLPEAPPNYRLTPADGPLVAIRDLSLSYRRPLFEHFDFTVERGEHWQILGPNGAGKSTLLSFISGDNPLVYSRQVSVCGYRRGSGESIWDVKRHLGIVSGSLHLDYRVSATPLTVILSGFYDSIGLYRRPGEAELSAARAWLRLLGMEHEGSRSFSALSFGRQRLLLIARALIKEPALLILDEPLQGLDGYGRALVCSFVSFVMGRGRSTVLFVSHHREDLPSGCTWRLELVPRGENACCKPVITRLIPESDT